MPKGGSHYPRKIPFDGFIDATWDDEKIERFIRAMHFPPHEGAVCQINGVRVECSNLESYKEFLKKL
jgi:methionyl-tRNA formyltransferase